jgi:hypothetical protein
LKSFIKEDLKKKTKLLTVIFIFLFLTSPIYSQTFDFNNGTNQGWRRVGLYDNGGLTPIPGFFSNDPAPWVDGQNSPNAPPGFDPLGNNIGALAVGTGGATYPNSPTNNSNIHWDL